MLRACGLAAALASLAAAQTSNPILSITSPAVNATYYYGGMFNLTFSVDPTFAANVGILSVDLLRDGSPTACPLLAYPYQIATSPTTVSFPVPECAPPSSNYQIRLSAYPNFFLNSPQFEFAVAVGRPCSTGNYDADGREPGCLPCPVGTFWVNPRQCNPCPAGTSTFARGATSQALCNRTIVNATRGYAKFDQTFFYHSNAGGLNLIEYDHKTQEECLQLCTQSPGCKAFDSGDTGQFQAGDCFLSYDNGATIKTGDVRFVRQLELFEKIEAQSVRDIFFQKRSGCYIAESNDGGVFRDEHSPEACAQLCLNDASCKSFDAGQVRADPTGQTRWIDTIDDCYLSYENRNDVPTSQFVCNASQGFDYYERVTPRYFEISASYASVLPTWDGQFAEYLPNNVNFTNWYWSAQNYTRMAQAGCNCNRRTINGVGGSCRAWGSSSYGGTGLWCHVNAGCNTQYRQNVPGVANAYYAECYNQIPLPCPVAWNRSAEVIDRYPFLRSRDEFASAALQSIANTANVNTNILAARIENSTDSMGNQLNTMTLTVQITDGTQAPAAEAAFGQTFTVDTPVNVNINGAQYSVTMRNPVPCVLGYVSQSGFAPGCQMCPPNSYMSRSRTDCVPCPLGTVSDAGSYNLFTSNTTGEKACKPTFDTSNFNLGAFRVGRVWNGYYSAPLGVDGNGRTGNGALTIKVTRADYDTSLGSVNVEVLVSVHHGEDCPPRSNCRDPGVTQYYANAQLFGSNSVYFQKNNSGNSWHGITDRNTRLFVPGNLDGQISVLNRNTVFRGTFEVPNAGNGNFVLWEQCYGTNETGGFLPGNIFVGTYACYRPGTNMVAATSGNDPCLASREGNLPELNLYNLQLHVIENNNGVVRSEVDLRWGNGQGDVGQYEVQGTYNPATGAIVFNAGQGAWITNHPDDIPARQISGRLSDDGEQFTGQYNFNPLCVCDGVGLQGVGTSCTTQTSPMIPANFGAWCTVNGTCPNARPVPRQPNIFYATCNVDPSSPASTNNAMATCSDVVLYRVCSAEPPICEPGWTFYAGQYRCYQSSTRMTNTTADYAGARAACEARNATLVSIHSNAENVFVRGLMSNNGNAWIGLNQSLGRYVWHDDTPFSFSALVQPIGTSECGSMRVNTRWGFDDCSTQQEFVCRKVPGATSIATTNCGCNGQRDAQHRGGYCNFWDGPSQPAWCYGSPNCPSAVLQANNLSKVSCYVGAGSTTTGAPTAAPPPAINCGAGSYQSGTTCVQCPTASSCNATNREVLVGSCGSPTVFDAPQCVPCPSNYLYANANTCTPCDARCGTCAGPRVDDCTSCVAGSGLYLFNLTSPRGSCIPSCHANGIYYKDNATQLCVRCFQANPQIDSNIQACGEFTDTSCPFNSCPVGYQVGPNGCCRPCILGETYSNVYNGTCQAVTGSCSAGQYTSGDPTISSDRVCTNCTVGVSYAPNGSLPTCLAVSTCPSNTPLLTPATTSTDVVCSRCGQGQWYVGNGPCTPVTPCGAGQEVAVPATPTIDNTCRSCVAGTNYSNDNGNCQPVSQCAGNAVEVAAPTVTSDRQCSICTPGSYFSTTAGSCQPWSPACSAGQFELTAPSVSNDRVCNPCTLGVDYTSSSGQSSCSPVQPAQCSAGQYEQAAPTVSSNRVCSPCTQDVTYQPNANANSCMQVTATCGVGQGETAAPTLTSDRQCGLCTAGVTFNANSNGPCAQVQPPCGPGTAQTVAPTASNDRVCTPCTLGSTFSVSGGPCLPVRTCGPGTEATRASTLSSDRVCTQCAPGTFRPLTAAEGDRGRCLPALASCSPDWVQVAAPTATTNRICVIPTTTPPPTTSSPTTPDAAASSGGGGGGGGSIIIIIIVILVVLAAVIGAWVYTRKKNDGGAMGDAPAGRAATSFDNPLYAPGAAAQPAPATAANEDTGYMDMPPVGAGGGVPGGYMDVDPAYDTAGAGDESGYMDTQPFDGDDEEDV